MSTQANVGAPPGAPPVQGGGGGGGDPQHPLNGQVTVTVNMPPKEVLVTPGNEVSYGGHTYYGGEDGNDQFVIGEGGVADSLALLGVVVILNHNATAQWNGKDGDAIRKQALSYLDTAVARETVNRRFPASGKRATHDEAGVKHDHGFSPYKPAGDGIPMDLTSHRQALAQQHMNERRRMTEPEAEGKAPDLRAAFDPDDDRHPDNAGTSEGGDAQ